MATAPTFYQDPNRAIPGVGQAQGQPDPIYHAEFAPTQYDESPHPGFDGSSLPRDLPLQTSFAKLEAKLDELQGIGLRLLSHAKAVVAQSAPSEVKEQLQMIREDLARRDGLESLEDKVEKVADWMQQTAKKIADLHKMMELNVPRR